MTHKSTICTKARKHPNNTVKKLQKSISIMRAERQRKKMTLLCEWKFVYACSCECYHKAANIINYAYFRLLLLLLPLLPFAIVSGWLWVHRVNSRKSDFSAHIKWDSSVSMWTQRKREEKDAEKETAKNKYRSMPNIPVLHNCWAPNLVTIFLSYSPTITPISLRFCIFPEFVFAFLPFLLLLYFACHSFSIIIIDCVLRFCRKVSKAF